MINFDLPEESAEMQKLAHDASESREQQPKKIALRRGIIYGPVQSRRLGISLGINLLPTRYKSCSSNCLYCQYAGTKKAMVASDEQLQYMPSIDAVATALETTLVGFSRDHKMIDAISICGNGEPTLYPALSEAIVTLKKLRDRYQPQARVAILSNSSTIGDPAVRTALELLDLKIMKFDAGSEEMFRQLNHPTAPVYMGEIVAGLKQLNNLFLQSCFVQGRVTNADPDSVGIWIERIREIHPLIVQVYSVERERADKRVEKVSLATLQWIAGEVRWRAGVASEAF
jgi:wyosine [tRNA(Phe)-imidazoG37] synthetase (radical SAM superfamily)